MSNEKIIFIESLQNAIRFVLGFFLKGASFIMKTSNNTDGKSLLFCYSGDEVLSLYTGTMYNTIAKTNTSQQKIFYNIFLQVDCYSHSHHCTAIDL